MAANPYTLAQIIVPPNDGTGRKALNKTVFQCNHCETQHWFLTISGTAVCCNCRHAISVKVLS